VFIIIILQAKGVDPSREKYSLDLARGFTFHSLKAAGLCNTVTKHMKLFDFTFREVQPAEDRTTDSFYL
jgi:hypothetical protein